MHDALFENQEDLTVPALVELARGVGLSPSDLQSALNNKTYAPRVRDDFLGGVRSGVNGTPTFFINGKRHDGPFEFDDLAAAIEARLNCE